MKLVGITSLQQAHPDLVNTRDIDHLVQLRGSRGDEALSKL